MYCSEGTITMLYFAYEFLYDGLIIRNIVDRFYIVI